MLGSDFVNCISSSKLRVVGALNFLIFLPVFDINANSYILIISVFYLPSLGHIFSALEFCLCAIVVS